MIKFHQLWSLAVDSLGNYAKNDRISSNIFVWKYRFCIKYANESGDKRRKSINNRREKINKWAHLASLRCIYLFFGWSKRTISLLTSISWAGIYLCYRCGCLKKYLCHSWLFLMLTKCRNLEITATTHRIDNDTKCLHMCTFLQNFYQLMRREERTKKMSN